MSTKPQTKKYYVLCEGELFALTKNRLKKMLKAAIESEDRVYIEEYGVSVGEAVLINLDSYDENMCKIKLNELDNE